MTRSLRQPDDHGAQATDLRAAWTSELALRHDAWWAYARSLNKDDADAEDTLHDVLAGVLTRGVHPQDVAPAYVYAAIRNAAHSRFRKTRRQTPVCTSAEPASHEPDDDLHRALVALADSGSDASEVITLKHGCGLTLAQIARVTGRPLGTIAAQHRRALEQLRSLMPQRRAGKESHTQ